ncbi:MAG: response regulator [Bacteriovorax sp.]
MKKLKILIADDEEDLQDVYEMILESEFALQAIKVKNGNEAIAELKAQSDIDLILSDYNMPLANGGKIYLYNKLTLNLPFFLFSGGSLDDYTEFTDFKITNKLNHFFNKPFHDCELIAAVKKTICALNT